MIYIMLWIRKYITTLTSLACHESLTLLYEKELDCECTFSLRFKAEVRTSYFLCTVYVIVTVLLRI